jgi:hypothetical protein
VKSNVFITMMSGDSSMAASRLARRLLRSVDSNMVAVPPCASAAASVPARPSSRNGLPPIGVGGR